MGDILQTVRTLTDMGIARNAIADVGFAVDVLEQLDFEPECEGTGHPGSEQGHESAAKAEWLRVNPCGNSMLVCAARAQWLLERGPDFWLWDCGKCGSHHQLRDVRFIPLNQTGTS